MNTLFFKYALEVAKFQSISQAADSLYMAQPNLSKAIKELESELDITIFERTKRGVVATPQGRTFLEYAANVLSDIERMKSISNDKSGRSLRICIPKSFTMTEAVSDYIVRINDPELNIDVAEMSPHRAISSVSASDFCTGIIRVDDRDRENFENFCADRNMKANLIWSFSARVTISADHILGRKQVCTKEMLGSMVKLCDKYEALPYSINQGGARENLREYYVSGMATRLDILRSSDKFYMLDSPVTKEKMSDLGITQLAAEEEQVMHDYFVSRKNTAISRAEKTFLDCIYSVRNTLEFMQ